MTSQSTLPSATTPSAAFSYATLPSAAPPCAAPPSAASPTSWTFALALAVYLATAMTAGGCTPTLEGARELFSPTAGSRKAAANDDNTGNDIEALIAEGRFGVAEAELRTRVAKNAKMANAAEDAAEDKDQEDQDGERTFAAPGHIRSLILLADVLARSGKLLEADATLAQAVAAAPAVAPLGDLSSQRAAHYRMGMALEASGSDEAAEGHYTSALEVCAKSAAIDPDACNTERDQLIRLYLSQGRFLDAEPLVLARVAATQATVGAYDLRLSFALADASEFYARQGRYELAEPLFARSYQLWNSLAAETYEQWFAALEAGKPGPLPEASLRQQREHFPFTVPPGLRGQALVLRKLGQDEAAREADQLEQRLWSSDEIAIMLAEQALEAAHVSDDPTLESALLLAAIGRIELRSGKPEAADVHCSQAFERLIQAWPLLGKVERRRHVPDYAAILSDVATLAAMFGRKEEAVLRFDHAVRLAEALIDPTDSLYLDRLTDLATAQRKAGELNGAQRTVERYLELTRNSRGETHPDYAWGLQQLSYVQFARGRQDLASQTQAQAREIWDADETIIPEF